MKTPRLKDGRVNHRGRIVKVKYAEGWRQAQVITHTRGDRWLVQRLSGLGERTVINQSDWRVNRAEEHE